MTFGDYCREETARVNTKDILQQLQLKLLL